MFEMRRMRAGNPNLEVQTDIPEPVSSPLPETSPPHINGVTEPDSQDEVNVAQEVDSSKKVNCDSLSEVFSDKLLYYFYMAYRIKQYYILLH